MSSQATALAARELAPSSRRAPEGRADPRLVALHRAARAAIVNPAIFAVSLLVIHNLQVATFAVFGCFALLVMADFGGHRPARAVAYVAATIAGAALVALGTAVSPNAGVGAAVMLVVGFTLAFAGVFGGYLAAAQTALLLAFVLSVSIPAPMTAIPTRVGGWLFAGAVSTLAGVFFWPWFERVNLRKRAAEACLAVADLVQALRRSPADDQLGPLREAARAAVQAMRGEYSRTAMRPAGPTRRDRALVELMTELEQIVGLAEHPFHQQEQAVRPCIVEGNRLAATVTAALSASAAVLTGGPAPDIGAIDEARRAHRAALDRWTAEELRAGRAPEEVLQGIDVDHTLRVIAYVTIALSANAVIVAGGRPDDGVPLPPGIPRRAGSRGIAVRVARTLRTHLEPSSTVLHNSLRVAIGLAVSVALARTLGLGHAFWVVLGTLSVLRSNALGTGRTTVQALAGSVIGFVAGGLFAVAAGNHSVVMWIAMPIAIFLASYAASAVGFVAGQAAFTLTVIIIFNLISPAGWQVGLVRIEDVAVGTGISVVVGVMLWPRGARRDLARAAAGSYRAVAGYVERAFGMVLGVTGAGDIAHARAEAVRARDRAGEAFDVFLNERGTKPLEPQTAGRLVSAGNHGLLAGDLLVMVAADLGYRANACPDGAAVVEGQLQILLGGLRYLADELAGRAPHGKHPEPPSVEALRDAAIGCMRRSGSDEQAARGAMAVVIAGEWVQNLTQLETDLEQTVDAAVTAARVPWWR
ncbi:MAG TPA: FUSC family protein [Candidatus Dormibacteraeota bacterium]